MDLKRDQINVSVRIRPVLSRDHASSSSLQLISKEPPVLLVKERSQTYHFDNIFSEDADQDKIYNGAVKPFVDRVKQGYNCTVFAYGQTGTGKTYTMGSGSQKPDDQQHTGIIPRALEQLFEEDHLNSDEEIDIFVSFAEIYNEKVFDLLQPDKKKTPLPVSGFKVQGLSMRSVKNVADANELLEVGNKNRHVGETKQNINSSRSHAIFTVYFSLKNSSEEIKGMLNLVDLAGSERVRKTLSRGSTFHEGININKGLFSIGQVISALSNPSAHIPYRQSMITTILQGSLNLDNYISLIACISANLDDTAETLQTLDFAQRTKKVRSNPEVNQVIAKYRKENPSAFGLTKTPMKRPYSTPLKTSAVKKMALPTLPLINESTQSQLSNVDSSKSQFSINFSSLSSANEITQQNLSPVIRKYMTKMEVSIRDHLESVIKSTLRRPTRASLLAEKSHCDYINKENTPNLHWSQIQNEVSKMVKNELAQMTVKTAKSVNRVGITSSPIEDQEKHTARRLLIYDSPDHSASEPAKSQDQSKINFSFKVPELLPQKKTRAIPSKISISPIENEMPKLTPRRSVRLSLKKMNITIDNNDTLNESKISFDSSGIKRTPRIMSKKIGDKNDTTRNISEKSVKDLEESSDDSDFNETTAKFRKTSLFKDRSKKLKNIRCAKKKNCLNDALTPANILVERALKTHKNKDSPYTAHSKKVLSTLNRGTQRDVEKLHLIGAKTAEQILLFRKLKGSFSELEDLSKLPGWGLKKYEKFVSLNFLRKY